MTLGPSFVLVAHRGASAHAPENTITSFDAALAAGFPHFETDCQLTSDGAVIVLHDEQLGRTTPGARGAVADTPWAALRDLDAGSWYDSSYGSARIPLLREVLVRYGGCAHVHLELKSAQPQLPTRVAEELRTAGWLDEQPPCGRSTTGPQARAEQCESEGGPDTSPCPRAGSYPPPPPHPHLPVPGLTLTSFHLEQLRRSLKLLPSVLHGWLVHEVTHECIQYAVKAGIRQLCPRANVLTPAGVQLAVRAGLSVRAWGVKDMQLLRHVVSCGCQGATVNWPEEAREALTAGGG